MKKLIDSLLVLSFIFTSSAVFAKTQISWWMEARAERDPIVMEKLVNAYNSSQDEIELVIEFTAQEVLGEKLRTALISGGGPDIVRAAGPSFIKEYQMAGMLENLDSYADQYGWNDKIVPWAYNSGVFDGSLYALPLTYESMIMLYNKTLFAENGWGVPTTLEELENVASKAKAMDMNVYSYGSTGWQPTHEHLVGIYLNNYAGPENVYKALIGEKKWTDPVFVEAIELLRKHMVDEGYWSGSLENYYAIDWDQFHDAFSARDAAMMTIGTWTFQRTEMNFSSIDDDWGWAPLPSLSSNSPNQNFMLAIGTSIGLNPNSKNKDAAASMLNWLFSNKDVVINLSNSLEFAEFNLPLYYEDSDFPTDVNPKIKDFLSTFGKVTGEGNYGYCTWAFWPAEPGVHIWKDMEVVWAGDISVADYMADHQKLWDKARDKGTTLSIPDR
jgi:raffinose/stachyose/melibiose transport system substrate-binding protein